MMLNESQWKVLTSIFENRGYRYGDKMCDNGVKDLDEDERREYYIWKNLATRIRKSVEGSVQRLTDEQKHYIYSMVEEYQTINCVNDENEEEALVCGEILEMVKDYHLKTKEKA